MELQTTPGEENASDTAANWAWMEWVMLAGYAGIVALAVSCALGVAVVLVGA